MSTKTSYRKLDYVYGAAMQKLRNAICLTQVGLADRLGVSWRTIAGWEAGSSYPRAEHIKELIALAVQQQAFAVGHEAEEIRVLWKVAHQKMLLDERWLSALLDQQGCPQGQSHERLRPGVEPEPVEETMTTAQITEQEPVDEEPAELGTPSDQPFLVRSLHQTGLNAVACQPQGQSHERLLETRTTGAPPPLPNGSFPQTPAKTNADQPRRKLVMGILIALVILTIIGSAGTLFFYVRAGTTTQVNKTVTDQAYPGYLSGKGTLAFFDPLSQESGSKWSSHGSTDRGCQFTGSTYHVSTQQHIDYFRWCLADGIFGNFAIAVQLTITQGDCGGITFRDDSNDNFYKFTICQYGTYFVDKYMSASSPIALRTSNSSAIRSGLGQQNKIAVVASGSTMTFYVNERQVDQVNDSNYNSGKIALIASPRYSHVTDVAYSNAKLWRL